MQPLTGVKVLDLTQFESGTVCTETLAWLGAEVLKVERPHLGEQGRYSDANPGVDTYGFAILNMNKKSITCDVKTPEGLALIKRLLALSDVFVENMGPGTIERLGLGYEDCRAINDKIIYASIKGFAPDSPYASYPAFEPVAEYMGGFASLTGFPDRPVKSGVSVADSGTGMTCALAILAALYQRATQGVGQRVDIAMQDYIIGLARSSWEPYYNTGKVPRRVGNGMPLEDVAPEESYPCKPFGPNDIVHIYTSRAPGSKQFDCLCRVIGREDLLDDPRMATPQSRFIYQEELNEIIAQWTRQHTKHEAMELLAAAGVPAGAMLDVSDITNDPSYTERGMVVETEHPVYGKFKVPGFAPKMSRNNIEYQPFPALGQSNDEIYGGLLGLSEEEREALRKKDII